MIFQKYFFDRIVSSTVHRELNEAKSRFTQGAENSDKLTSVGKKLIEAVEKRSMSATGRSLKENISETDIYAAIHCATSNRVENIALFIIHVKGACLPFRSRFLLLNSAIQVGLQNIVRAWILNIQENPPQEHLQELWDAGLKTAIKHDDLGIVKEMICLGRILGYVTSSSLEKAIAIARRRPIPVFLTRQLYAEYLSEIQRQLGELPQQMLNLIGDEAEGPDIAEARLYITALQTESQGLLIQLSLQRIRLEAGHAIPNELEVFQEIRNLRQELQTITLTLKF